MPFLSLPGITTRYFLTNGKLFREKMLGLLLAREFASSKLLVVCTDNDDTILAVCGIRSLLNVLVLFVKKSYRGHGIGAQLLKKTVQAAKKRQLGFITLSVSSDNIVASHLYSTFGFKEVVFLKKTRLTLMMLSLTPAWKRVFMFFRMIGLLLPNTILAYIHAWLYRRTL